MRAADLLPKLLVILEDDAEAVVAVFDGALVTKPRTCAPECESWQDAVLTDDDSEPDACTYLRRSPNVDVTVCIDCTHPFSCHQPSAFALSTTPAMVGSSAAKPAGSVTDEAPSPTRRADGASTSTRQ